MASFLATLNKSFLKSILFFSKTDQFDLVEDANFNAPVPLASVAADGPTLLSGALPTTTTTLPLESEEEVKKPVIELRNYFPENWLFSLENMTDTINTR